MDAVPIVLIMLVMTAVSGGFILAELASDLRRRGRYLRHDLNGSLSLIMMELDKMAHGYSRDAVAAKHIVTTIKGYLHPEGKQWVNLRHYLRLIVSSYRHQEIEYYDSARPTVKVDVAELHRVMVNVLQNALEAWVAAGGRQPVRIHLEESTIKISNPATEADLAQMLSPKPGSTRREGRGSGIGSIRDSCERIGWEAAWTASGTRAITTLRFA